MRDQNVLPQFLSLFVAQGTSSVIFHDLVRGEAEFIFI